MQHAKQPEPHANGYVDEVFETWWADYPRKIAKADAKKAWMKMTPTQRASARYAIPDHVTMWHQEGRSSSTIPYPATWLRRESWNDELAYTPPQAAAKNNGVAAIIRRRQEQANR